MLVLVKTDNHIEGSDGLQQHVQSVVDDVLGRFGERITRVEVHLGDENSGAKPGEYDKRCSMEARLAGLQPIAVSHRAATIDQAIDGAAEKLQQTIDRTLGRLDEPKGRISFGGDQSI